jgi:hypothetical protein
MREKGPGDAELAASEALLTPVKAPVLMTDMTIDEYEKRILDTAVEWTASKFLGRGQYNTRHDFTSFDSAMDWARNESGPGTIIYAVDANGRHVLAGTIPYPKKKGQLVEIIKDLINQHPERAKLRNQGWFFDRVMLFTNGEANTFVTNTLLKLYLRAFEEDGVIE